MEMEVRGEVIGLDLRCYENYTTYAALALFCIHVSVENSYIYCTDALYFLLLFLHSNIDKQMDIQTHRPATSGAPEAESPGGRRCGA